MHLGRALASSRLPPTVWICRGFGDRLAGAFDRWHITSTDLHPAALPAGYCYPGADTEVTCSS